MPSHDIVLTGFDAVSNEKPHESERDAQILYYLFHSRNFALSKYLWRYSLFTSLFTQKKSNLATCIPCMLTVFDVLLPNPGWDLASLSVVTVQFIVLGILAIFIMPYIYIYIYIYHEQ